MWGQINTDKSKGHSASRLRVRGQRLALKMKSKDPPSETSVLNTPHSVTSQKLAFHQYGCQKLKSHTVCCCTCSIIASRRTT